MNTAVYQTESTPRPLELRVGYLKEVARIGASMLVGQNNSAL
jgi:hypothetical protein